MHEVRSGNSRNLNEWTLVAFDETARLLKSDVENKVAKAMGLFFSVSQEERNGVYEKLYGLMPFAHYYWGCAEDAFLNRNKLTSTPEQKAQAIESYLTQMIAGAQLNSGVGNKAIHILFRRAIDLFHSGDVHNAMALFAKMPREQKEGVYEELLYLVSFDQGSAEEAFYDRATPEQRAQAIQNYLIQSIADLFKSGGNKNVADAMDLFAGMPQTQKEGVFGEIYRLVRCTHDYWGCAEDAFYHRKEQSSTPNQKAEALQNYLIKSRPVLPSPTPDDTVHVAEPKEDLREELEKEISPETEHVPVYADVLQSPFARFAHLSPEAPLSPFEDDMAFDFYDIRDLNAPIFFGGAETKTDPIASEPELDESELAFEQDVADFVPLGERSLLSIAFLNDLSIYKHGVLMIGKDAYLPISGGTQNFSRQRLASCGSHPRREILLLDPDNSPKLTAHYARFRSGLQRGMTTQEVLSALKRYVRNEVFPSCLGNSDLEAEVNHIVDEARKTHPVATRRRNPSIKIPLMSIDDFIGKAAVCRDHGFVIVFMVDCLLNEKDPLIEGTVQLIRGNLTDREGKVRGAHVWTTFIPKKRPGAREEKLHLDTFWDQLVNFAEDDSMLRALYGASMIDDQIHRTNYAARINGQPEGP